MPRKSPYVIALTNRERAELEARSRDYTLPYREVVRAKIVLLASQGHGNDQPSFDGTCRRQQGGSFGGPDRALRQRSERLPEGDRKTQGWARLCLSALGTG